MGIGYLLQAANLGEMVFNWFFLILRFVNGELNPHDCEGLMATVTGPEPLCHHCTAKAGFKELMRNLFFLLVLTGGAATLCVCSWQWLTYLGWQDVCWAVVIYWGVTQRQRGSKDREGGKTQKDVEL